MRNGHVYKRKDSGVWWCWWYDAQGKRHCASTKCTDKQAAQDFLRERELDAHNPARAAARDETLGTALDRLILRKESTRAKGTVQMHADKALRLLEHFGASAKLESVVADSVDDYIRVRLAAGRSHHTIHKELTTLRSALKLAKRAQRWVGDPSNVVPAYSAQYKPRADRWLSIEEVLRIVRALPADRAARVLWAAATGSEWAALERAERGDLDTKKWTARVRGTKRSTRDRVVPLVLPEQRQLAQWAHDHGEGEGGKLFAPWTHSSSCKSLKLACDREGVQRISWHDLRRSCAQWLAQRGCTPDLIALALGNSPAVAATVYARLDPVRLAARIAEATGCSNSVADGGESEGSEGLAGRCGGDEVPAKQAVNGGSSGDRTLDQRIKSPVILVRTGGKRRAKRGEGKRRVAKS